MKENTTNNQSQQANTTVETPSGKAKNKWVALLLCLFSGSSARTNFMKEKSAWGSFICAPEVFAASGPLSTSSKSSKKPILIMCKTGEY